MLRNLLKSAVFISRRHETTLAKAKWDIHVGVLIERLPIISKNLNELELDVQKTFNQMEFESSLKSDHEIKKEKDKIEQELIKSGKIEVDMDADSRNLQSAQDFEDQNQDQLAKFKSQLAPRQQPPEVEKNMKNLNRKLQDTLMLICEQKVDGVNAVILPQDQWQEGETLKQTAERIVKSQFGDKLQVRIHGNSPCGFYKYKYKSAKGATVGAKVFFYRAGYRSGDVENQKLPYEWVNQDELSSKVRKSYYDSVSSFLI